MLLLEACVRSGAECETIKALISAGVSPNERGGLATAASLGRCDIMELLISAGACIEGEYRAYMFDWRYLGHCISTPAIAAAASKCAEAVELLVCHNIDLNASLLDRLNDHERDIFLNEVVIDGQKSGQHNEKFFPIQAAVDADDCDFVKYLIEKGASVTPRYGPPLLVLAAQRENIAMMALLLDRGANVNSVSESGSAVSALEAAAKRGHLPGMKLLIGAGAHVDFCSSRAGSRTPLQRAAAWGQVEAVKMLLGSGADINAPHCPIDGVSTLQALIQCQNPEWVIGALAADASVNPSPGSLGSPLLTAVATGNSKITALLIRLGANFSQPAIHPESSLLAELLLPLQLAARDGYLEVCKILVEAGAEVDGVVLDEDENDDGNKDTPLVHACHTGEESVASYLISKGACLLGRSTSYTDTPLCNALSSQHIGIVRLLLERGLDPNKFCVVNEDLDSWPSSCKESTPLIEACEGAAGLMDGEEERELAYDLAKLLIRYGADVSYRPSLLKNTPLQIACIKSDWKLAKLLLSHDADVNALCSIQVDHNPMLSCLGVVPTGMNAFQAVILKGNMEMVKLFLSKGVDVHAPAGCAGCVTALQAAVTGGHVPIAEILLKAGAQVDEPPANFEGRTSMQLAAELGRLQMLSLLLHNYRGTQPISEMCEDATKYAQKEGHEHVVGFLRECKERSLQPLEVETQNIWELDDWINSDCAS